MSVVPPAGNGTMILIGLVGKACANAPDAVRASAAQTVKFSSVLRVTI